MRRTDNGSATAKTIFALTFLGAVAFIAVKTLPPYINNYDLQDHIRQTAINFAARGRNINADDIKNEVVTFAQAKGIPVSNNNVKVAITSRINIDVDYTVPVDLKVYTLQLHFTDSAYDQPL
jgi:uncharacterized protein (UPF0333 family)